MITPLGNSVASFENMKILTIPHSKNYPLDNIIFNTLPFYCFLFIWKTE